jgi:hypothetical protein
MMIVFGIGFLFAVGCVDVKPVAESRSAVTNASFESLANVARGRVTLTSSDAAEVWNLLRAKDVVRKGASGLHGYDGMRYVLFFHHQDGQTSTVTFDSDYRPLHIKMAEVQVEELRRVLSLTADRAWRDRGNEPSSRNEREGPSGAVP